MVYFGGTDQFILGIIIKCYNKLIENKWKVLWKWRESTGKL